MLTQTYHDFILSLRQGRYTSIGSYPVSGLFSDGGVCCYDCMRKEALRIGRAIRDNEKDGWQIIAVDVKWENDEGQREYCEQCGNEIEVAYN